MPLQIVRNDITKMKVDAIVNAANEALLGGGGVDGAIHRAAGPGLLDECRTLGGCKTGDAKITGAYNLSAKYVIHTVGPIYLDGKHGEEALLESCYRKSLALAKSHGCESIAFPLISAGAYSYPKAEAFKVATRVITEFLLENEMTVYIVIFDRVVSTVGVGLIYDIIKYVDKCYVDTNIANRRSISNERTDACPSFMASYEPPRPKNIEKSRRIKDTPQKEACILTSERASAPFGSSLAERLNDMDESFSEMLLRKIDEKGMTDVECYKKANIDRKLFSKIRSDLHYKPSKQTAIAFAISLELSLPETEELLKKAGYALSHSSKFDIIIEYFILKRRYDIFKINEALFAFDQSLLGG